MDINQLTSHFGNHTFYEFHGSKDELQSIMIDLSASYNTVSFDNKHYLIADKPITHDRISIIDN